MSRLGDLEPVSVVLIDPRGADPIRAELLGLERLESHARALAPACVLAPRGRAHSPLLESLFRTRSI